jgi:hypothetical protein
MDVNEQGGVHSIIDRRVEKSLGGGLVNAHTVNRNGSIFLRRLSSRMYRVVNSRRVCAWDRAGLGRLGRA